MFSDELRQLAADVLEISRGKGLLLATAESCTGGLIAALLTDIPGSSDVFERGFTTYSYRSKTELLGVEKERLEQYGAVSREVVAIMAEQARVRSKVDITVAVSGIAGPGGAVPGKPVGTVFIGVSSKDGLVVERCQFDGDRTQVRMQTVEKALYMLKDSLRSSFVSVA